jgi:hypothetical protein
MISTARLANLLRFSLLAAGLLGAPVVRATWQDDIGYTRLKTDLGPALPRGAGVPVTLVEATLTAEGGEYLPSVDPAPVSGIFAGKVFRFESGLSPVSNHAVRVASFFFGANTNPLAGDASVAPLAGSGPASTVDCYDADGWLAGDFLRVGSPQMPRLGTPVIANHSWIASVGADFSAGEANETLQRLDWAVEKAGQVVVVGLNNGAATVVPPLLGSAYNVLSVGRTDGWHSTGASPAEVDGAGRAKPELVAPMTATSWSTAVVSSCAALLAEAAATVSPNAGRSEVLRALLLAGARKDPFPNWANAPTRPLDGHFGAGEVNVWRSHRVLVAGEFAGGVVPAGAPSGWHYAAAIAPGEERGYPFRVPEGCVAREFSAALVWNRVLQTASPNGWTNPSPQLANLDLRLHASAEAGLGVERARSESGAAGSVSHPLEHVFVRDLAEGEHLLRVQNAAMDSSTTGYGLAWFGSLAPAVAPEVAAAPSADGRTLILSFSRLGLGLTYALESSADLQAWAVQESLTASSTTATVTVGGTSARAFFRLRWVP